MYAAIFRVLPGPLWLRIVLAVVLVAGVLVALAAWVFPYIDSMMIPADVTVTQ
jgi:hypothetical protein